MLTKFLQPKLNNIDKKRRRRRKQIKYQQIDKLIKTSNSRPSQRNMHKPIDSVKNERPNSLTFIFGSLFNIKLVRSGPSSLNKIHELVKEWVPGWEVENKEWKKKINWSSKKYEKVITRKRIEKYLNNILKNSKKNYDLNKNKKIT